MPVRKTDRMRMRQREEADSECVLAVNHEGRPLKDLSQASHRNGKRAMSARGPKSEQRLFKADCGMHHLELYHDQPTILSSQSTGLLLWWILAEVYEFPCAAVSGYCSSEMVSVDYKRLLAHTRACLSLFFSTIYCRANLLMDAATLWFTVVKDTLQV